MHIEFMGRDAIVQTPEVAFTYQVAETPREFDKLRGTSNTLNWDNLNDYLGDYVILPYGSNNDLPDIIKEVVKNNYIAPGLLNRKTELLWGLGPRLYREKLENNKIIRQWVDDKEVQKWLESFDYENYLLSSSEDYQHLQGTFTKIYLNKGTLVGKPPKISKLEHIAPDKARLALLRTKKVKDTPTHCVISDWNFSHISAIADSKVYPLFDYKDPFSRPNSIMYSNKYSFCTDYYTIPDIYGSLEWLNRSTSVPLIFKALSKNSINLKYHIISPAKFWDKKKAEMMERCSLKNVQYTEEMFLAYQKEFLEKIGKVLSGEENTGKYLHTVKELTVDGTNLLEHQWEVKVIDQNIKDFVEAQIKISQRADRAVASGISLHSALGNMSETGKVDSGSEQHYALISYLNTGIDIQEMIITKPLNYAIKANFPDSGLKIGFYHNVPEKQEDVSPSNRSANNSPLTPKE
jgi:hypothetical protein